MRGHILILTANILFGISVPLFKYLLSDGVPPEAIALLRSLFACMMFWGVSLFAKKENVRTRDLLLLLVCGLCGVGINQLLFVVGLERTSPVDASIISSATPILVLLLASVILRERITHMKVLGIALGISGGLLLVYGKDRGATSDFTGNMLVLANYLMYAFYIVLSRRLSSRYTSVTIMKWMFLFSSLALTPLCLTSLPDVPVFHAATFSPTQAGALFYLMFGSTFLAFMLVTLSLKYLQPTTVSMYNYVQPTVACIIAISVAQDTFSLAKLLSAVLIFFGVYFVTIHRKSIKH